MYVYIAGLHIHKFPCFCATKVITQTVPRIVMTRKINLTVLAALYKHAVTKVISGFHKIVDCIFLIDSDHNPV